MFFRAFPIQPFCVTKKFLSGNFARSLATTSIGPYATRPTNSNSNSGISSVQEQERQEQGRRFVEETWRHSPAMTVHRLQSDGQDRPITAISRQMAFEPNQPYVAVSRATGRGALYLLSFDRSMVATYPLVAEYYQRLRYLNQEALREPVDHPQR